MLRSCTSPWKLVCAFPPSSGPPCCTETWSTSRTCSPSLTRCRYDGEADARLKEMTCSLLLCPAAAPVPRVVCKERPGADDRPAEDGRPRQPHQPQTSLGAFSQHRSQPRYSGSSPEQRLLRPHAKLWRSLSSRVLRRAIKRNNRLSPLVHEYLQYALWYFPS